MSEPALHTTAPAGIPAAAAGSSLLGLFAIPLGLAGTAGVWQTLRTTVSAPGWPAETLFAVSALIWAVLTFVYFTGGVRHPGSFASDRQHVIHGPFAAYLPIIGILLSAHYVMYLHDVARVAVVVFVAALAILAAQLLAHWLRGNLPAQTFHPGYFLPTVAGSFIASIGLSSSGWHEAAESAFGVGIFFWLTIGTLIFGRLFTGAPLPDAVKPSLAVLVSPPATGGVAWFLIAGGHMEQVGYLLLGILFMMILIQVLFFAEYHALPFTPNFWAFTFPAAASSNLVDRWLSSDRLPHWQAWSWLVSGITTAFVLLIAVATLADLQRKRSHADR